MNTSQIYILNPQKLIQFYKGFVSGHHNSYSMPLSYSNQHGGSITASSSSFMIPIEDKRDQDSSHQKKKLTVISPAQQVVEQAKLTLQRQNRPVYRRTKLVKKINHRPRTEQKQRKKSKRKMFRKQKQKEKRSGRRLTLKYLTEVCRSDFKRCLKHNQANFLFLKYHQHKLQWKKYTFRNIAQFLNCLQILL